MNYTITGTKKQILELIKRRGRITPDETSKSTGLAKTTLREHFLQLERDEYIGRSYIRSGPGRPGLQYHLTRKGNGLFPSSESELIKEFLLYLKEQGDENKIQDFFEKFWDKRLKEARRRMESFSEYDLKEQLKGLAEMLEEEGFMPEIHLSEKDEQLTVKECNCPFSEVVKVTRLPCQLEAMFYKKLFNEKAERTTYIAEGDYTCTYQIPT